MQTWVETTPAANANSWTGIAVFLDVIATVTVTAPKIAIKISLVLDGAPSTTI